MHVVKANINLLTLVDQYVVFQFIHGSYAVNPTNYLCTSKILQSAAVVLVSNY